jgi:8-oxo-dGTP pyrophosphatase MutT (NUDIX family)
MNKMRDPIQNERAVQLGALCWRVDHGMVQVLLVTSRETGRWVIPKGWPMSGKSHGEAALQEAFEEAGVKGRLGALLGDYAYDKVKHRDQPKACLLPCRVQVHGIQVTTLAEDFPEARERRREWVSLSEAALRVDEPGLKALLTGFQPVA